MAPSKDNLIWLDMEMTGLEPRSNTILEIATVITDNNLRILAEGPVIAVHQTEEVLAAMDEWNTSHHTASGLCDRVRNSRYDMAAAEQATLVFVRQWVEPGCSPLCGNSICQDRRFLSRLMPKLDAFFHYRHLDVSTIKELARRWRPEVVDSFHKENKHLALSDIRESIAELRHYCCSLFLQAPEAVIKTD